MVHLAFANYRNIQETFENKRLQLEKLERTSYTVYVLCPVFSSVLKSLLNAFTHKKRKRSFRVRRRYQSNFIRED